LTRCARGKLISALKLCAPAYSERGLSQSYISAGKFGCGRPYFFQSPAAIAPHFCPCPFMLSKGAATAGLKGGTNGRAPDLAIALALPRPDPGATLGQSLN
jgi:hypothetical protein